MIKVTCLETGDVYWFREKPPDEVAKMLNLKAVCKGKGKALIRKRLYIDRSGKRYVFIKY